MFAIIVNPVSGTHANETLIQELIELIEARGHRAKIFATEWKGDATNKARLALEEGYTSVAKISLTEIL